MEERILDTASEMFLKYGFKSVSTDEIASELGISKKTLYNYFSKKEELVARSIIQVSEKIEDTIQEIVSQKQNPIDEFFSIRAAINEIVPIEQSSACSFQLSKYYPESFKLLMERQSKSILETISNNIERGISIEIYRTEIDKEIYAKFYLSGVNNLHDHILFKDCRFAEAKDAFLWFFLYGICNHKGINYLEENYKHK